MTKMTKIYWNRVANSTRNEGYKTSTDEIVGGLQSRGFSIEQLCATPPNEVSVLGNSFINIQYIRKPSAVSTDILINNTLPEGYVKSDGYNIGFTYWETNKLPDSWIAPMNSMDEIWTTSQWAVDVFKRSGVTVPIYEFKLGIDDSLYFPVRRKRRSPFTFFSIGSPSTRKNSQLTVNAFIKLFGGDEDCRLIYKSMGPPDARINPGTSSVIPLVNHPKISVYEDDLSASELADLYDLADCVVFPTSGEGWGFMPMQGIAKGIPTICTNATACTEYAHLSVPLGYEDVDVNLGGIYKDSGTWAKPDFQDLCDKMLYVFQNYEYVSEYTYENATKNYEQMTWDFAIDGFENRLCQILKNIKKKQ